MLLPRLLTATVLAAIVSAPAPLGPIAASESPPNVVLVTLDTTRADALGCYGNPAARTAALDRVAAEGIRYARALTAAPLSLPAHCSLLTGLDPPQHGVRDNGAAVLPSDLPTLATVLAARGYATAAVIGSRVLDRRFGLARGFELYDDRMAAEQIGEYGYPERDAAAVTAAAIDWLARRSVQQPASVYFLWVHYYDPHAPYAPPAAWRGPNDPSNYAGEIAYMDQQLGRLLDALPHSPTVLAVVGDHGEALGDHGERAHGLTLYRASLEVPLILRGPGIARGRVVEEAVAATRLAASLLRLLGMDDAAGRFGAALPGLEAGAPSAELPIYSETWMPATTYGWAPLQALTDRRWRMIAAPRPELYDYVSDPAESNNLWAERSEIAAELQRALRDLATRPARAAPAPELDPELTASLRSLGYLQGAGHASVSDAARALDPKDGLALLAELEAAKKALAAGHTKAALQALQRLVQRSPNNAVFLSQLARAQTAAGQTRQALASAREALALNPQLDFLRLGLADAYRASGELEAARREYEGALEINPRLADAWLRLGEMAFEEGDPEKERGLLSRAVESGTDSAAILSRLAQIEIASGELAAAGGHLQRAVALAPSWAAAWLLWGDLAERQDRPALALERYLKAVAASPADTPSLLRASRLLLGFERHAEAAELLRRVIATAAEPVARDRARQLLEELRQRNLR